jgi:hypothetical protein
MGLRRSSARPAPPGAFGLDSMEPMTHRLERDLPLSLLPGRPGSEYLVYTSAGDRGNVHRWLRGQRNFDLWITYYGEHDDHPLRGSADLYNRRKGSKFQNLLHAYRTWAAIIDRYTAVLVMDDDILIDASAISRLFEIRARYDLWVLQPAFHPRGKISHPITRARPGVFLRYTNFVEMNCPLFRRDKLDAFMRVYDPVLTGFGMDWWYLEVLGEDLRGRAGIVDAITCVTPMDHTKGGVREMDRLQPFDESDGVLLDLHAEPEPAGRPARRSGRPVRRDHAAVVSDPGKSAAHERPDRESTRPGRVVTTLGGGDGGAGTRAPASAAPGPGVRASAGGRAAHRFPRQR